MWKKILLIGDSNTEWGYGKLEDDIGMGWVSMLSNQLARKADVVNRGFSG
jgi:lysophospholipase L1-like esterase